jgi:hypothetical protein
VGYDEALRGKIPVCNQYMLMPVFAMVAAASVVVLASMKPVVADFAVGGFAAGEGPAGEVQGHIVPEAFVVVERIAGVIRAVGL